MVAARRQFKVPNRQDLAYFALLGFLGITFHQWLQSTGLETSAAATTAWIVATIPVFTALLGWLGSAYLIFILVTDGLIVYFAVRLWQSQDPASGRRAMRGAYLGASVGLVAFLVGLLIA